jgi:hypothetical protein
VQQVQVLHLVRYKAQAEQVLFLALLLLLRAAAVVVAGAVA